MAALLQVPAVWQGPKACCFILPVEISRLLKVFRQLTEILPNCMDSNYPHN